MSKEGKERYTANTRKIITGLEEVPLNIFKFGSLNIDKTYLDKKEVIQLLISLLGDKSEDEIRLILNISKDIFSTYKEK